MSAAPIQADPLLQGLNERQFEAVTMADDSAIILAGAGSGKTKVLTTRIAWLVREARAGIGDIMAVTFTNKASREMRTRLAKMTDVPTKGMWIGTFHGLCHRMLQENYRAAGFPAGFTIMDEDDQVNLVKRLLKENPATPEDMAPAKVQKAIARWKEQGLRASRVEPNGADDEFMIDVYRAYEGRCVREGVIDFAELMLRVSELFESDPEFTARYQNRFSHILVDEFQDTNDMQYAWLRTIRGERGRIFAVGDDDQSIYAFRGSNPQNMNEFVRTEAGGRVIRLEQNYRSTGNILGAANALIGNNRDRMGKELWTSAGDGAKLHVMRFESDFDEADRVASTVRSLIQHGTNPSEIALLYRSNYQSRAYEKSLMACGVPYVIYGGLRFYERMEVKNALAYLKLVYNMNDDGAFRRVVNFPVRGIGEASVDRIAELAESYGLSMFEAAATKLEGPVRTRIDGFTAVIADLADIAWNKPLPELMEAIIARTGLVDAYSKKEEDKDRVNNLKELVSAAQRFCEECEIDGAQTRPAIEMTAPCMLGEFLATATLESAADKAKDPDHAAGVSTPADAVTLMTVHAAKGLEFDAVVITGAEDGVFPLERSIESGAEEEERRLMYVAITRARKRLYTTTADSRWVFGQQKSFGASRFLAEIPAALKEETSYASSRANQNRHQGAGARPAFARRG